VPQHLEVRLGIARQLVQPMYRPLPAFFAASKVSKAPPGS
jgi:hypothetical protein